jgi:hypothetical protein
MSIDLTTFRAEDGSNTKRRIQGIYTGPSLYVAGGESLTPAMLKLGQLHQFDIEPLTNGSVILLARYDYVNEKLKVFDMAGAESAAIDLSTYSGRFEAIGL